MVSLGSQTSDEKNGAEQALISTTNEGTVIETIIDPTTESFDTIDQRIDLVTGMINRSRKLLEINSDDLTDEQFNILFTLMRSTYVAYDHFLKLLLAGKFDFIPEVKKFKGLLVHDSRKPVSIIASVSFLGLESNRAQRINLLSLKTMNIDLQLQRMLGATSIISSINEATRTEVEPRLSIQAVIDLLGLKKQGSFYILSKPNFASETFPTVNLEIINQRKDDCLTITELFTLDTLLINLANEKQCSKGKVLLNEDSTYSYITVSDDIGSEWPENVKEKAPEYYAFGFDNPEKDMEDDKGGLKMVLNLAGQRHKQSGLWKSAGFVKFANVSPTQEMKSISVAFSNLNEHVIQKEA